MQKEKLSSVAIRAIVVGILLNLCAGAQYVWSMLGRSIINEYGWTTTQATAPYSVMTVVACIACVFAGRINDSGKPKYGTILGGICMAAGLFISSRTQSPAVMILSVGVLIGCASPLITNNTSPTATKLSPASRRGFVGGLVYCGMGFSSLYMAPVVNALLKNGNVSSTFNIMAIAALILITVFSFFLPDLPKKEKKDGGAVEKLDEPNTIYNNEYHGVGLLKTKDFYIMFALYICGTMAGMILNSAISNIASVQCNAPELGYLAVMALAIGNGVGRFAISAIADKVGATNAYRILFAIAVVDCLALCVTHSFGVLVIETILLGAVYGGSIPLCQTAVGQIYGSQYLATTYAIIGLAFGVSGFVGPMIAAACFDINGTYVPAYIMVAVITAIGFALTFALSKKKAPAAN